MTITFFRVALLLASWTGLLAASFYWLRRTHQLADRERAVRSIIWVCAGMLAVGLVILGVPVGEVWVLLPFFGLMAWANSKMVRVCPNCLGVNTAQPLKRLTHCRQCKTAFEKNLSK